MKARLVSSLLLVALSTGSPVLAAGLPVKAPPKAAVAYSGGWYLWADGSYQSIHLPSFDLGFRGASFAAPIDRGVLNPYEPRADGWGVSGGVGFLLPPGSLPALSNGRIEIGSSYVEAEASANAFIFTPNIVGLFMLGGPNVVLSGVAQFSTSSLTTDYKAWQVHGRLAGDFKAGAFTFTPSLALFGGAARNNQNFQEIHGNVGPPPLPFVNYTASSSLDWTDIGARFGMDASVAFTSWLVLGINGTIGLAHRAASLAANDRCSNIVGSTCNNLIAPATSISASASAMPVLANVEASVTFKPAANTALRGFAGLNFDSDVPGLRAPGPIPAAVFMGSSAPGGIKFESEISYYAGGGMTVTFASAR